MAKTPSLKKVDKYVLNQILDEAIETCSWCDNPELALQYLVQSLKKAKITKRVK